MSAQILLIIFGLLIIATPALAIDTVETWAEGDGNVELYSGFDGVGEDTADQALAGAMLMGWGVANRFSAYMATAMEADGYFTGAETELNLGVFGTPVDTDHFDVDLILDMRVAGHEMNEATVVPAIELNLDHTPDLGTYGMFVRGAAQVGGSENPDGEPTRHTDLGFDVGGYYTLSPNHQLLLMYDATIHDKADPEKSGFEHGAVALGYNALLGDNLELITETSMGIAQAGSVSSLGFMVGFIATLPGIAD